MKIMRWVFIMTIAVGLNGILGLPGVAVAQTTVFMANVSNHWHSEHNWTHGLPNASVHAVIPPDQTCVIDAAEGNALAASINVQGMLIIDQATLTIARQGGEIQSVVNDPSVIKAGEVTEGIRLTPHRRHTTAHDARESRRSPHHRRAEGRRR